MIQKINGADLFIWPDGSQCSRDEYEEYGQGRSDDFIVLPVDSAEWMTASQQEAA